MEIEVNPNILNWAIARAGLAVEELLTAFPKLPQWLSNSRKPTLAQLERFSQRVHLPFGMLFLEEPPIEALPFTHFRSSKEVVQDISLELLDTVNLIEQRQAWIISYLEDLDAAPLSFIGRFTIKDRPLNVVTDIIETLKLDGEDWITKGGSSEETLKYLAQKAEEAGLFVFFNGCVGNNTHRPLNAEEFRGFVLVHKLAPCLFINNADAKTAQLFTFAHELAHVWLGESAAFENAALLPADNPVEKFCDQVAAEFLVPQTLFESAWKKHPNIKPTALYFRVSPIVIARRALDLKKISKEDFFNWYSQYTAEITAQKEGKKTGGSFWNTAPWRVGRQFSQLVHRAVQSGQLTYKDAYRLTGLRGETYHKYVAQNLR